MLRKTDCHAWVTIFLALIFSLRAWAESGSDLPREPEASYDVPQKPGWRERWTDPENWENWHDRMADSVVATAERIDRFFGDERLDDDNDRTRLRLGSGILLRKGDGASLVTDIKARLALPRLKNRFQLIVDDNFESDEPGDAGVLTEAFRDSEPDTALRYILHQKERRRLSADLGVRFSSPSQIFGRLRGRITVPYAFWELRLTQTGVYYTDDGLEITSQMRWTRPLLNDWIFRSSSRLTWEEQDSGITPAQSFTAFKTLTQRRAYAVSISGSWPETPHSHSAQYTLEFTYRQLIHSHWLFMEIAPALEFPQEEGYGVFPRIEALLEIVFEEE